MIIGIIAGFTVFFAGVLVGRYWNSINSVTDIESVYKAAVTALEDAKTLLQSEITAAEAKAASLKNLL